MNMNDEQVSIWKKAIVTYFPTLFQKFTQKDRKATVTLLRTGSKAADQAQNVTSVTHTARHAVERVVRSPTSNNVSHAQFTLGRRVIKEYWTDIRPHVNCHVQRYPARIGKPHHNTAAPRTLPREDFTLKRS